MRKTIIATVSIIALTTGCVKTDLEKMGVPGDGISAVIETPDTRATLSCSSQSGDYFLVWQKNDTISLFDGTSNIKCRLSSGAGQKFGTFIPEVTPASSSNYYAVYPYSGGTALSAGKLILKIPDTVEFNSDTHLAEDGINVMVSSQATTDIKFKNLCSYIIFNITGTSEQKVEKVVIEGTEGQVVAGDAQVTFSKGNPVLTFVSQSAAKTLTVRFGTGEPLSSNGLKFTVAVPPVFNDGFKATVFLADGVYQEMTSSTSVGRNEIVDMPSFHFSAKAAASIGGTKFTKISEAFDAANASVTDVTIKLCDDIVSTDTLAIENPDAKVTLDLAGKSLFLSNTLKICSESEILDSDGSGTIENESGTAVLADAGARLTISGGTVTSSASSASSASSSYTLYITNGGKVIIDGDAHIVSRNYRTIYLYGSDSAQTEATLEVRGGWIQCADGKTCIVNSRTETAAVHRCCFLSITGGHFSHFGKDYDSKRRCIYRGYANCSTSVSGGFFDTNDIYRYYNDKPHDYTAEGCSISSTKSDFPSEYAAGYTYYIKRDGSKSAIDKAIRKLFDDTGAKNLVVLAYKGGKEVYSATFGYRCAEPGNIDTLEMHDIFRIASISKSFIAGAMVRLVGEGLVDLDAPVNDYLSRLPKDVRFSVINKTYPDVPITVRMLLNHTSTIDGSPYTGESCFKNITYSTDRPGEVYSYSNMGSCLAAAVVEIASGKRLDEYVKDNLLDKIDMPHSGHDPSLIDTLHGPKFVYLYTASGSVHYTTTAYKNLMTDTQRQKYVHGYNTGLISPAGNIKTNAHELARWMRTLQLGGLSPDGVRVIPEEMVNLMHNSVVHTGAGTDYGLFISRSTSTIPGVMKCGHTGSYYGAHSSMSYGMRVSGDGGALPVIPQSAEDWGVITLASGNDTEEGALGSAITRLLYNTLLSQ